MYWGPALALVVLAVWPGGDSVTKRPVCKCSDATLCQPLDQNPQSAVELVAYDTGGVDWKHYIWSKVTTIIAAGKYNAELLCHSHANGVRVLLRGILPPIRTLMNAQQRKYWIGKKVQLTKRLFTDGFSLHIHEVVVRYSEEFRAITQIVREMYETFHKEMPSSRVIIEVPWTPECAYGRCYDYAKLADYADFLLVMGYNTHTPTNQDCFAKPNSPYNKVLSGISGYLNLGIRPSQLVLGVSWFGVDYTCKRLHEPGGCELSRGPGKNVCSFKAGHRISYKKIMQLLPRSTSKKLWGNDLKVPSFTYKLARSHHEVWYDNPESISSKSALVNKLKLLGIGMWTANSLNYSSDPAAVEQTNQMWNALYFPGVKYRAT